MQLSEAFDAYFKFKIGQLVVSRPEVEAHRVAAEIYGKQDRFSMQPRKVPLGSVIIGRILDQCHGGIQGHYVLRRWTDDGREVRVQFAESELVAFEEILEPLRAMAPMKDG